MKKLTLLITIVFLLIGSATDALATGFGYYGTLGKGTMRFDNWWLASETHSAAREDAVFIGAGMLLDTAVALNRVFNYRLNIGYEKMKIDSELESDSDRLEGVVIDQDFGAALYRSDTSRIWFGPELRILFSHDDFGMGVGPVLGMNLHTGEDVSVALKLGYLFSGFAPSSDDYERESHAFVNLAMLFRSDGDKY